MNSCQKYFSVCALALLTQAAFAQGTQDYAVLSAAPDGGGAVTCTRSSIDGNVGSSGQPASVVETSCGIEGAVVAPVSAGVLADFESTYAALALVACPPVPLTGTLAGVTLAPGVYCFDAAATLTGTLTLDGGSTDVWLFKVGANAPGALTGTNFAVVMANGTPACNVTWWVDAGATMTDSDFKGTIFAGAAITMTGLASAKGAYEGRALARAAVTVTDVALLGCEAGSTPGHAKSKCNQGVGNGPEGCDPGNSNQGNPFGSNDEQGGMPGNPGRKGGNNK